MDDGEAPLQENPLIFLTLASSFLRSYLWFMHNKNHLARAPSLAKLVNQEFYCRYLVKRLKKMYKSCHTCRKSEAEYKQVLARAPLGPLPASRLNSEQAPFEVCTFDTCLL